MIEPELAERASQLANEFVSPQPDAGGPPIHDRRDGRASKRRQRPAVAAQIAERTGVDVRILTRRGGGPDWSMRPWC
jgi:hypothetical protein